MSERQVILGESVPHKHFERHSKSSLPLSSKEKADRLERQIAAALVDLRHTSVREIMTPRMDVVAIPVPVTVDSVIKAIRESGHSRFPVYDEDLDRLTGILFVPDLFRAGWLAGATETIIKSNRQVEVASSGTIPSPSGQSRSQENLGPLDISRRLRQPYLVPESGKALEVLADMRDAGVAFAVVVDEYGGVAGVLTLWDLLSALVGDLRDELDGAVKPEIVKVDVSRWLVEGTCSVEKVRDQLGLPIPEGEYVTLGGFLFDVFGRIPEEGDTYELDQWELQVVEMDLRRIAKVLLRYLGDPASYGSDNNSTK